MNNEQAEGILLGSILLDNTIIKEISLMPEHFYSIKHRKLYEAMQNIVRKNEVIDAAALVQELGKDGLFQIGGGKYLKELKESVASMHAYKNYESIIMKAWKIRETENILKSKLSSGIDDDEIQSIIRDLNQIDQVGTKEVFNLMDYLIKMYELPQVPTPIGLSGIPSGFKDLDLMTDGFQDEDSIIVGARPSMGKTAFALNIAMNAGMKGIIPVVFSLEMSAESLIKRCLSALAKIDGYKVKNPYHYFNDNDRTNWIRAIGWLEKINIQIFDKPHQKINEMRSQIRQVKATYPDRKIIVLIDYLTLIKPANEHNGNAHLQVSEISSDIKTMAKEFKCPIITLAQLSRSIEQRKDKHPMMSDLRESGSIEQDADIIMFLYRDEYYNDESDKKNILEVDIAKQRNGATGMVELQYQKEVNLIRDLVRKNGDHS